MPSLSLLLFLSIAFSRLALYQVADRFRSPSPERARATLQWWAQWACRWWRLQVAVAGTPLAEPCVYVANHRTYLDIPVLAGVLPASFLSRADVARWPLVGTIARLTDTVLVERHDTTDRLRAARTLLGRMQSSSVVVFPEATTTGERLPASFRSGIFRLVQWRTAPIVPVTLRYSDRRAYWTDDITIGQHVMKRVLAGPPLAVQVHIGRPLHARDFAGVDELAAATYTAVCQPIELLGELL